MEKTCITMQPDLPESEPENTCSCKSETEQLRTDMSELQERVHKIENLLAEKDKMMSTMEAHYNSLVQRLDTSKLNSMQGQCNNIDLHNSENELLATSKTEQIANFNQTKWPEDGNGELDHTVLLTYKEKRNNKDVIQSGSEIPKRKIKPKRIPKTHRHDIGHNITDTSKLSYLNELPCDNTCVHKKIDISKKNDNGKKMLSNLNFISRKSKEKSACPSRRNKNDCQISKKTLSPKDENKNGKNDTHGIKVIPLFKEDRCLEKGEIKSLPEEDNDMIKVEQRLQKAAGQTKRWDIQPNDNFIKNNEDVKNEKNLSKCKQSSDDKQTGETSAPHLVQSPVKNYDESVSHDTDVSTYLHVDSKTYEEDSAKGIIGRENTCRIVNEKEMEMQNEPVDHSLNDSQHIEFQNFNDDTYTQKSEKETFSNSFDIQDKQISYDELSTSGSYEKPFTGEFMIQNDDGNELINCKSTDFSTTLSEANTETTSVHQLEMKEINDIHQFEYQSQSSDKEQSCNEFLDKADNDFDFGPHQNSNEETTNCGETKYNAEPLLKQNIDIYNNDIGCESMQSQEMVCDINIDETKDCLVSSSEFSHGTNTNVGGSQSDIKTKDENRSSTSIAEHNNSNTKDVMCSTPKIQSPEINLGGDKIDEGLVESTQDNSKTTTQDSKSLEKRTIVERDPKFWRALADVEQKEARKTLHDLRGAHSVICIDTSVGESASKIINSFVSEFLNGLVEMSGLRELKTEHVALVTFGHETKVQIRFTNDYHRILKCLDNLTFGGQSQIFGGLMMAFAAAHSSRYTRVINEGTPCIYTKIIMLTDGRPSYSTPDMDDASEIDETKAMILQEMETIRKNCHDLFIIPIGAADIEFLNLMVSIADGSIQDFTSGRQLSRRQFLTMNIKGPVNLKNNLVDDTDGLFSQEDQEDMSDIVEKSQRHVLTRRESCKRIFRGRRKRKEDGNGRSVETRERSNSGGSSDSSSLDISDLLHGLPGMKHVFESSSPSDYSTFKETEGIPVVVRCSGNSAMVPGHRCSKQSDVSKYFEVLCSPGHVLGPGTSPQQKQPAAKQKTKTPTRHPKNKNKIH